MSDELTQPKRMSRADQAGFLILGSAGGRAMAIIAPVVLTRILMPDEFGTYRQLMLLSSILAHFAFLGLPGSVLYFYPRLRRSSQAALVVQLSIVLGLLGLASAAALVLLRASVAEQFNNPRLAQLIPLFSIYAGITIAVGHVYNLLVAQGRVRRAALFSVVLLSVPTLGAVVGVLVHADLPHAVAGVALGGLLVAGWAAVIVVGFIASVRAGEEGFAWWDARLFREQLAYGVPLGLAGAIGTLERHVDHLVVSSLTSPAAYAAYSLGAFVLPFMVLLANSVSTALIPAWARAFQQDRKEEAIELFRRSVRRIALIALPGLGLLYLLAPDLIRFLFSDRYAASIPVFRVFLFMLAAHTFSPSGILKGMGHTRVIFVGQSVAFLAGAGLVVAGIHVAGLPGAALGKVAAECLRKGIYAWVIRRRLGAEGGSLFPWSSWLRIAVASAAAAAPTAAVALLLSPGLLRIVVCGAVFAPACLGALLLTRSLTLSDRELLLRWISLRALLGKKGR